MTYEIHRYPTDLIDVVRLAGGERIVIRPVLPQDADLTRAFFRDLSAPARYDRFMTGERCLIQVPDERLLLERQRVEAVGVDLHDRCIVNLLEEVSAILVQHEK